MLTFTMVVLSMMQPPSTQSVPRTDAISKLAHEQLLAKARTGRIDAYFVGDSLVRRWGATDYPAFLTHWRSQFHGWNAANFGWGGDTVQNVLWRLQHGELDGVNPKVIVVLAGTNNIGTKTAGDRVASKVDEVVAGLKAIIGCCREKAPQAVILITSLTPRNDNPRAGEVIRRINSELCQMADGKQLRYINLHDALMNTEGKLRSELTADGLHFTQAGYQKWAELLKPVLLELLGPPGKDDLAPPATGDPSANR
jgi:lysophospholipase L1-like esterase